MTGFAAKVAELVKVPPDAISRLAGGDLSEVLLVRRLDGRLTVAKSGPAAATEAAMLRALAGAGAPVPLVEGEHPGVLLIEHVANDGVFSENAWRSIGAALRRLHANGAARYGWPVDYQLGTVALANSERSEWPAFWAEQRLLPTAALLDRPWRQRVERTAGRLGDILPSKPQPSLLHGDLWSGNILVSGGALAAFIDPACYYGHSEVDLAMLSLFDSPADGFSEAYGEAEPGWEERRHAYQLFPALVHLRLFGTSYAPLANRLLRALGA